MYYGILVATASSDRSADPPRRAAMLAATHATKVEFLSVLAPAWTDRLAPWLGRAAGTGRLLWQQAGRRLVHQAARLRAAFGIRCTAVLGVGGLAEQTLARVQATTPSLVVLGWHAPTWLGRLRNAWAVGAIVRRSGRPVLVVRNAVLRPYARVLVAVDFSEASLHAVHTALRCAPGARFALLHSLDTGVEGTLRRAGVTEQAIERYRRRRCMAAHGAYYRFLDSLGQAPRPFSLVLSRHPERAALHVHAASTRPDLVVLGGHHCSILASLLGMSAFRDVLAAAPCDVLLTPAAPPPPPADVAPPRPPRAAGAAVVPADALPRPTAHGSARMAP